MANPLFDRLFGVHAGQTTPFLHLPTGETISHDMFLRMAGRYANALVRLGHVAGDRVALQSDKSPEALAVYAACVQAGLIFLPLNPAYTADELEYFLRDSGAKLFICRDADDDRICEIAASFGTVLKTLGSDGTGTFADLARDQPDTFSPVRRDGDDLVALLYTSGTTGRSKGAMLTQNNLLSNALVLAESWQFSRDDVLLHALPIFHTHGLFVATNITLVAGGAMIFLPRFDTETVIANLPKASTLMGVPTFYTRLLDDPGFSRDLTRHMRLFVSGSAPLLAETHTRFEQRTGHRILERYGMTETNMNTSNPYSGERRAGTVGFVLPGVELKITDATTRATLAHGKIGEIEVRGANVFKGYWNMPEKTAEALRDDGYFLTGDLGLIDSDGYVQIVGRSKDLIISGGYNIYPKEIELLLDKQPGILESAVIGVPDPDFGERVVAMLVAQAGATPDLTQIEKAITGSLARFKQPRAFLLVPDLPRNTMGKVQKNVLREKYETLSVVAQD